MKALTYYQPHATLSAIGAKTVETRPFESAHRGWFAIHAAKTSPSDYLELAETFPFSVVLSRYVSGFAEHGVSVLPAGAIVAVAWLASVSDAFRSTERWTVKEGVDRILEPDYDDVPQWEVTFGDYTLGRKAWWTTCIMPLPQPIPCKGSQGLWDTRALTADPTDAKAPDPIEREIERQLMGQGLRLREAWDPAMWRLVNRRGTAHFLTGETPPRTEER